MRVLFSPHRDRQHLFPMVPLAWACRAAGHEVIVAAAPILTDAIARTGLPAVAVGRDEPVRGPGDVVDIAMVFGHRPFPSDWPMRTHLLDDQQRAAVDVLGKNCARAAECVVDDLISLAGSWRPDLIVHDTAGFAGAVAAAALGVPNVRHLTGVGLQPMETRVGTSEPLAEYAALFERRGLAVRMLPDLTVDPSPPSLATPVSGPSQAMRYVPYNGPGVVPTWLGPSAGRPRVLVTWGLSVSKVVNRIGARGVAPFRLAIKALSAMDIEVMVAAAEDQLSLLGGLADDIRLVTGLPLHLMLPYCSAIVHQAGDGTTMTAAAGGVPQLTITRTPDNAHFGERLAGYGAGLHLRYRDLEDNPAAGDVVSGAVATLLDDTAYAKAAIRLREEIERMPTPVEVVDVLRALAGRPAPTPAGSPAADARRDVRP